MKAVGGANDVTGDSVGVDNGDTCGAKVRMWKREFRCGVLGGYQRLLSNWKMCYP